jgi:hypothetical protein
MSRFYATVTVRIVLALVIGLWCMFTFYASTKMSTFDQFRDAVNVDLLLNQLTQRQGQQQQGGADPIIGDLVWFTPPPQSKPRMIGWEDSFMEKFKNEHFDPTGKLRCEDYTKRSPYGSPHLCIFPGYIPARYIPKTKQKIPRTIFLSWRSRAVNPRMFASIMLTLNTNPEYELIFFNDDDIDQLVCSLYPDMAPLFGRLRAGAARADVMRMIAIYHYGGIYIDADLTCFRHIDVPANASVYGSVGGWGHIANANGILNHWAMAFSQWHPVVGTTLNIIWENLKDPTNPHITSEAAREAEVSETIRLTGPSPYQRALHHHLRRAGCRSVLDGDGIKEQFANAMLDPEKYCNMTAFEEEFGTFVVTGTTSQWYEACLSKELIGETEQYWNGKYDDGSTRHHDVPQTDFCTEQSLQDRANRTRAEWDFHVKQRNERGW